MRESTRDYELTTGEVADRLGVTPMTVIRYVDQRKLSCLTLPSGHRRFRQEEVDRFIAQGSADEAAS